MKVWVVTSIHTGEVISVTDYDPHTCLRSEIITECQVQQQTENKQ